MPLLCSVSVSNHFRSTSKHIISACSCDPSTVVVIVSNTNNIYAVITDANQMR